MPPSWSSSFEIRMFLEGEQLQRILELQEVAILILTGILFSFELVLSCLLQRTQLACVMLITFLDYSLSKEVSRL